MYNFPIGVMDASFRLPFAESLDAAVKIGLIPKAFRDKTQAVGNSALAGCYAYHLDEKAAEKITRIKKLTRVINLAEKEGFAETFVNNMNF